MSFLEELLKIDISVENLKDKEIEKELQKKIKHFLEKNNVRFDNAKLEKVYKELSKILKNDHFHVKGKVIVVTGPTSTGKSTFSKFLSKELGYYYFSAGKFFRIISEFSEDSKNYVELWEDLAIDLISRLIAQIFYKRKHGLVIEGRLAHIVCKPYYDISILITASLEKRSEMYSNRENVSLEKARKKILERDEYDLKRYKKLYNISDPWNYDFTFIVNMDELEDVNAVENFVRRFKEKILEKI